MLSFFNGFKPVVDGTCILPLAATSSINPFPILVLQVWVELRVCQHGMVVIEPGNESGMVVIINMGPSPVTLDQVSDQFSLIASILINFLFEAGNIYRSASFLCVHW